MTQKQTNEEKAMNNCEMYQGYVSIYELIDMLNEKYKFLDNDSIFDSYFFAENDHDEKLIDELTAQIITAIQKSKNYVDYLDPQDNDTMTYLIDVHSVRNVEVALHYYLEAKSSIMNPQALKERDNKLQSDQITKIAKDQVDKKRILVQIRTSGEYLDDQQFEKVENAFANWELLFGNSHDLISKIKMISGDLLNYGQIDYQERGSHDYRKDACLTMEQFEKIVIHCILYHNSKRSNDNFPYTEEMLEAEVPPYSTEIWKWGLEHSGVRLLDATPEQIILTLLPRVVGRFTRQGLKVNGLRYYNDGYVEMYLCGGETEVAYNPDDVSAVWIIENGRYIRFELIESRFDGRSFDAVEKLKQKQRQISKDAKEYSLQAEIQLARNIEMVANMAQTTGKVSTKGIRDNRQKEQKKQHIDYVRKVGAEDGLG